MTKINQLPISLTPAPDVALDTPIPWFDPEKSRHLIILIPANSDCTSLTRRICRLANETDTSVQLLGLYKDPTEELVLRRDLVTISALIREARVYAETKIEKGTDWVQAIKHIYQSGDLIVCLTEQFLGFRRRPLSQILKMNFDAPVFILSEGQRQESKSKITSPIVAWLGLIGILASFFFVQIKITQLTSGGFQTLLLLLLLIPEIRIIQVWNSIFF